MTSNNELTKNIGSDSRFLICSQDIIKRDGRLRRRRQEFRFLRFLAPIGQLIHQHVVIFPVLRQILRALGLWRGLWNAAQVVIGRQKLVACAGALRLHVDIDKLRADRRWSGRRLSGPFGISLECSGDIVEGILKATPLVLSNKVQISVKGILLGLVTIGTFLKIARTSISMLLVVALVIARRSTLATSACLGAVCRSVAALALAAAGTESLATSNHFTFCFNILKISAMLPSSLCTLSSTLCRRQSMSRNRFIAAK